MDLHNYRMGQVIGCGNFGEVRLAVDKTTGRKVAIKGVGKSSVSDINDVERVSREFYILTALDHKNVIRLYEVLQTDTHLYLAMEYAGGGSLDSYINKLPDCRCPDERAARKIFVQILSAIRYCHRKHVIHRDLKPENILLSSTGQIKVADFGLSNTVTYGGRARSPVGTPLYAAPEVLFPQMYPDLEALFSGKSVAASAPCASVERRSRTESCGLLHVPSTPSITPSIDYDGQGGTGTVVLADGSETESDGVPVGTDSLSMDAPDDAQARRARFSPGSADVWSLGCVLHRIVFGRLPYQAETIRELKYAIFSTTWTPPSPCTPALAFLLRGMLDKDPFSRMSSEEVSAAGWTEAGGRGSMPSLRVEEAAAAAAASLGMSCGPEDIGDVTADRTARSASVGTTPRQLHPGTLAFGASVGEVEGISAGDGPSSVLDHPSLVLLLLEPTFVLDPHLHVQGLTPVHGMGMAAVSRAGTGTGSVTSSLDEVGPFLGAGVAAQDGGSTGEYPSGEFAPRTVPASVGLPSLSSSLISPSPSVAVNWAHSLSETTPSEGQVGGFASGMGMGAHLSHNSRRASITRLPVEPDETVVVGGSILLGLGSGGRVGSGSMGGGSETSQVYGNSHVTTHHTSLTAANGLPTAAGSALSFLRFKQPPGRRGSLLGTAPVPLTSPTAPVVVTFPAIASVDQPTGTRGRRGSLPALGALSLDNESKASAQAALPGLVSSPSDIKRASGRFHAPLNKIGLPMAIPALGGINAPAGHLGTTINSPPYSQGPIGWRSDGTEGTQEQPGQGMDHATSVLPNLRTQSSSSSGSNATATLDSRVQSAESFHAHGRTATVSDYQSSTCPERRSGIAQGHLPAIMAGSLLPIRTESIPGPPGPVRFGAPATRRKSVAGP